ncbi:MAG: DNA mismatch repair protein MutS [Gemmatimonadetes bacterium]|nr:DNA mismatch repair protein MutS [Gemmatimonadota bacterium]
MTRGEADVGTPLMQQYRDIKSRHAEAIVFFRMGEFYEMFYDDAELASRELGLTLTTRNNGSAAHVPLAGVPVRAAAEYVRRLVARGHRVAICEQMEDPRFAKGVVKRQVVETITPGATLSEGLLDAPRNNFLVAVLAGDPVGLAALDISTGELALETVRPDELEPALRRYDARELVVPAGDDVRVPGAGDVMLTRRERWEFDADVASDDLRRRFGLASLDGLGVGPGDRPALAAAGALLRYAGELQPGGLPHVARPTLRRAGGTVPLDEMTRRNLELVEPLRPGQEGGTVLETLDRTVTPMGARLLRGWLLAPLRSSPAIRARHDAVAVLVSDARGRERLRDALSGMRDIERLSSRAATHRATPRDLGGLRRSLERLPDVKSALDGLARRDGSAELERIAHELDLLTDLAGDLARVLVDEPPAAIGDTDAVRPGADADLDEARELRDGGKRFITEMQGRERERTGISSLKVGYNRVFGYYIEITKFQKGAAPADYERRQTLANAERYVTPELKDYEARVLGAEERIVTRERELCDALCAAVSERLSRLQATARAAAGLDVYAALADAATRQNYVRPTMTDEFALRLTQCRHPVVERMLPQGKFIPNDVHMDESGRVILLTGPNMAGKSTILRQVGLSVILAQIGSFVPADAAVIGVVDRVFTRVGASDNLGRGQSTFMVEMAETSAILHGASDRSLVLLDEIGRGTSTYDGVAIAWAVTEHLHDRIGCKTIFATHYHELTQLTETLRGARNFNVAVRETGDTVVFLHRLEAGGTDKSYGIHVGQLAGLPSEVVRRAWEILAHLESERHVAAAEPVGGKDAGQLALFESGHSVIQELLALDADSLTPLEALNRLADLKRKAEAP